MHGQQNKASMADHSSNSESSGEEEEYLDDVPGYGVQPYMFEPEYADGEMEAAEEDVDSEEDEEGQEEAGPDPLLVRVGNTDWCGCERCGPMPTGRESQCCHEMAPLDTKRSDEDLECITGHPDFNIIMKLVVLENTLLLLMNVRNNPVDPALHSGIRWAAYRQWTAWVHGKLGWKIRQPIPSCVVTRIRELYPKGADEEHVGYHEADSDLEGQDPDSDIDAQEAQEPDSDIDAQEPESDIDAQED